MRFLPLILALSLAFPVASDTHEDINKTPDISGLPSKTNNEVEVLHWWTSGGEALAVNALKDMMKEKGHKWKDFAVAGRAGESAINTLRTRALSGNPPDVAQIKGPEIQEWGELGFLVNIDDVAEEQRWNELVPARVSDYLKVDGHYVAAPFNIHRVNWLWANPDVFAQAGAELPQSMDEFFIAAEKIKAAGFIPLALGSEAWQETTLFESIALAIMGTDDFRKAFSEHNSDLLTGEKMRETLLTLRRMKQYTDADSPGRNWSDTTSLVIEGKAAMQMMGDWAKGEFLAANKVSGKDFVCIPAPGTANQFSFNIDSFVFFKSSDPQQTASQKELAKLILEPDFQEEFNLSKGSIPVRVDINMTRFDPCAQDAMQAFLRAAATDNLVASLSHNMAIGRASQVALFDVISRYYNDDEVNIDETMRHIRAAVLADKL
ncbi:sugar ABC transporter substrate-binding protein [Enterovibrio norvegicus FF-33]|uniref:ABC transporter substrate-binding protein n=1 Tax=Enterovibrio TaxID=188143 RepID=UPI00030DBD2F|nr:ABC transporter substrate-binding protein [Enterovibrio norvegicus]OEE67553.1 sugar ABC transporter substrate-binding protein [Enterovibrio norvegicus FF-33]OEE86944.1 sugar ABC transporter substrate-binding protein [Enterovibrio norvegicus FF-162]OEE87926.1 sugar ABC transporter substrate-binding protein [Enterovibrio norvegicus FF-162]